VERSRHLPPPEGSIQRASGRETLVEPRVERQPADTALGGDPLRLEHELASDAAATMVVADEEVVDRRRRLELGDVPLRSIARHDEADVTDGRIVDPCVKVHGVSREMFLETAAVLGTAALGKVAADSIDVLAPCRPNGRSGTGTALRR
jgi:hypothetical protein